LVAAPPSSLTQLSTLLALLVLASSFLFPVLTFAMSSVRIVWSEGSFATTQGEEEDCALVGGDLVVVLVVVGVGVESKRLKVVWSKTPQESPNTSTTHDSDADKDDGGE
jgi:hypothetical protein